MDNDQDSEENKEVSGRDGEQHVDGNSLLAARKRVSLLNVVSVQTLQPGTTDL